MSRVLIGSISAVMPARAVSACRVTQVRDVSGTLFDALVVVGRHPGHHMQLGRAKDSGVTQCEGQAVAELGLATGNRGESTLAVGDITRGRVEEHIAKPVCAKSVGDGLGGTLVR
jgi:hypothetical protein